MFSKYLIVNVTDGNWSINVFHVIVAVDFQVIFSDKVQKNLYIYTVNGIK